MNLLLRLAFLAEETEIIALQKSRTVIVDVSCSLSNQQYLYLVTSGIT
jgi:hypothetical protein